MNRSEEEQRRLMRQHCSIFDDSDEEESTEQQEAMIGGKLKRGLENGGLSAMPNVGYSNVIPMCPPFTGQTTHINPSHIRETSQEASVKCESSTEVAREPPDSMPPIKG